MNKEDYLHSIKEIDKLFIKSEKEYIVNIKDLKDEKRLIQEEYILEHAKYRIGDTVIYENEDGIAYDLIVHDINIDKYCCVIYDIGNIINITHIDISENKLEKSKNGYNICKKNY